MTFSSIWRNSISSLSVRQIPNFAITSANSTPRPPRFFLVGATCARNLYVVGYSFAFGAHCNLSELRHSDPHVLRPCAMVGASISTALQILINSVIFSWSWGLSASNQALVFVTLRIEYCCLSYATHRHLLHIFEQIIKSRFDNDPNIAQIGRAHV